MNKLRSLGVAMVFLAGCAVGGASGRLVVPKANAQQAATLTKWEYMCLAPDVSSFRADTANNVTSMSRPAGAQGWEMVAALDGAWCFKRPKM